MKRFLITIFALLTLLASSTANADPKSQVSLVFQTVFDNSLNLRERTKDSTDHIPKNLSNKELHDLAKRIKLSNWDLDTHGDLGITYIETAFFYCLYELAKRENGEIELIALLQDPTLQWDAGHSLILGDAIVKKGKPCIPLLQNIQTEIPHIQRYIGLIKAGVKTNI